MCGKLFTHLPQCCLRIFCDASETEYTVKFNQDEKNTQLRHLEFYLLMPMDKC